MSKYWYGQPGYVKSWDCAKLNLPMNTDCEWFYYYI